MGLPWRWFGTVDAEPDWLGELRRVLATVSDALPAIDAHQARWPSADWGDQPDHRALRRHWLLEQPELHLVRDGLERLGFELIGEPLPIRGHGEQVGVPPAMRDQIRQPWRPTARLRRSAHVTPPFPLTTLDAYSPASGAALRIEWERDPWPHFAQRVLSTLETDVRYLVLGRRWTTRRGVQTYTQSEQILDSIFTTPKPAPTSPPSSRSAASCSLPFSL